MIGTICVNGATFQINTVRLRHSRIELEANRWDIVGEFTIAPGDEYEIHGFDGSLIGRGRLHLPDGLVTTSGTEDKPEFMSLILPIGFEDKELS